MRPAFSATVDGDRALVRGYGAKQVLLTLGARPYWSESGRGWVVPSTVVDDLSAYAQHRHEWIKIVTRKDGAA